MEALDFLNKVEKDNANIEDIRSRLLVAEKRQLIAVNTTEDPEVGPIYTYAKECNMPEAYGIYRREGGDCLGVVGKNFVPANLELFFNSVVESIVKSGVDVDLSTLTYHEYGNGKRVAFRIPIFDHFVGKPSRGDVTKFGIAFRTGFDGKTKNSLNGDSYRIWCDNGCGLWESEMVIGFKNTATADAKRILFAEQILQQVEHIRSYTDFLDKIAEIEVTKQNIDRFLSDLIGKDVDEVRDVNNMARKRLDKIESAINIEVENTDMTLYSLLQGVTRFTTHDVAKGDYNKIHFNSVASKTNDRAHQLAADMAYLLSD